MQYKTSVEMVALMRAKPPVESPPAERISLPERIPPAENSPSERPSERPPLMDFLVNEVEVTSCISTPPLITRCDKITQMDPSTLQFKSLGKRPFPRNINSPIKDTNSVRFQKTLFG
ncbi:hypothetical protein TNCV_2854711 [Trichonephila clavipes]|nr:hypothetical protein TNCV_2854711 [Trichonephila clavipes]